MMEQAEIKKYISEIESKINSESAFLELYKEQKKALENEIEELKKDTEINYKAGRVLEKASNYARQQAIKQIELLATSSLQYIFKNNMIFVAEDKSSARGPGIEFYVTDEKGNMENLMKPEDSRGGGVVDVVSIGLRLSISDILAKSGYLGPIILDEPAKYVSNDYIMNVGLFLKEFSKDYERQIIMVTHDTYLSNIGDKIFSLSFEDGKTIVNNNFSDEIVEFQIDI